MDTKEIIKKYGEHKSHLESVSRLSRLLFSKLLPHFPRLENFNNKKDLKLLEQGSFLHDIGIHFEKAYELSHHKAGAKFIFENKPDDVDEEDLIVLCCLIRYHRKSLPNDSHNFYKKLKQQDKAKVDFLGALIKLADAMDEMHINLIEDFEVEYDKNLNVLTLVFSNNIMLNTPVIEAIEKKKDFFESTYKTKLKLKGQNV